MQQARPLARPCQNNLHERFNLPALYNSEGGKPGQVPHQWVGTIQLDPMDPQDPMREDAVDDVPNAETNQQCTDQRASVSGDSLRPASPKPVEAYDCDKAHQGVEIAVPQNLKAEAIDPRNEA